MAATAGPSASPVADTDPTIATTGGRVNVDGTLDSAFTLLLQKGFQAEKEQIVRPITLNFNWGGGGQALNVLTMDPILAEVPCPSTLVWARMYAGDATANLMEVSSTVELRLTNFDNFGSTLPVYQSGTIPTLDELASVDLDITDWLTNFDAGDLMIAYPVTFTGLATWMALVVRLRPSQSAIGTSDVTDNAGDAMTTNDGAVLTFRA